MLIVPLQATPSQVLSVILANQSCRISVYQKFFGLYFDLVVPSNPTPGIRAGVSCLNGNRLIRYAYLGFIGDFLFFDTQGKTDPVYTGLGTRYQLAYLEASDLVKS